MCNARTRCAGHTGDQLKNKNANLREKSDALAIAESNLIVATKNKNLRSIKKFTNEVRTRKASVTKLKKEISDIQRSYDGTPTGKAQLEERMTTCDPSEYPILFDRLVKGKSERSWKIYNYDSNKKFTRKERRATAFGLPEGSFSDERVFS